MRSPAVVELYCEDSGHEAFCTALAQRLAADEGLALKLDVQSGRGGKGRAITEFKYWQRIRQRSRVFAPDLGIIVIDANCVGPRHKTRELARLIRENLLPASAIGTPDPHVERWMLYADPAAFAAVVGQPPPPDPGKCDRNAYKTLLRQAVDDAGMLVLTGPMEELSSEVVQSMDFYQAGKNCPELGAFIEHLRGAFRRLGAG